MTRRYDKIGRRERVDRQKTRTKSKKLNRQNTTEKKRGQKRNKGRRVVTREKK